MPKVSIIVPNYNHAKFLDLRVRSVLGQTRGDFEVLILDDHSTDDSLSVIEPYKSDSHVRVLVSDQNSGSTYHQWNKGVCLAKGEFVWLAESDDWADDNLLETLVPFLENHPNVGLAFCGSMVIDTEGVPLGLWGEGEPAQIPWKPKESIVCSGREAVARWMVRGSAVPNASAVVFRKSLYEQVGGADPAMTLSGDYELWVKMMLVADVAYVAEPLNYFRTHVSTVRSQRSVSAAAVRDRYAILRLIRQSVTVSGEDLEAACASTFSTWVDAEKPATLCYSTGDHLQLAWAAFRADPHFLKRLFAWLGFWNRAWLRGKWRAAVR